MQGLAQAAALTSLGAWLLSVRQEQLVLLEGLGVLIATTYACGAESREFLDLESLVAVVINEASVAFTPHFTLAVALPCWTLKVALNLPECGA